jgi:hypothetical protein
MGEEDCRSTVITLAMGSRDAGDDENIGTNGTSTKLEIPPP